MSRRHSYETAYMIFSKEKRKVVRAMIREEGGVPSIWSVSKTTSQLWRDLPQDEKQMYYEKALQSKQQWEEQVNAFFDGKETS